MILRSPPIRRVLVMPIMIPFSICQNGHPNVIGWCYFFVPGPAAVTMADRVDAPCGMQAADVGQVGEAEAEEEVSASHLVETVG